MTQELTTYIFVWTLAIFAILSFAIWLEKMIKIILWNYILWWICFALSISIDLAVNSSTSESFINFMTNWKTFIVLLAYVLLLFLVYYKSNITVEIPRDQIMQKSLYLFFVPLTVLSMCLTLEILLLWTSMLNQKTFTLMVWEITKNIYLQEFIINTPYWVLIHGISTIIITSGFKTTINTDTDDVPVL